MFPQNEQQFKQFMKVEKAKKTKRKRKLNLTPKNQAPVTLKKQLQTIITQ
jgi:hypothetical protein